VHPPVPRDAGGELALGPDGVVEYDASQALRTTDGVSRAVSAEQVAGSLVMFGLIYLMLGAVWIFLLNEKIQRGPKPLEVPASEGHPGGFFESAQQRPAHGDSMTEAHEERPDPRAAAPEGPGR